VRALKAEGRGIREAELRPERLEGGPIALIRDDRELRGFLTLQAAIEAAQDKDILEVRADGSIPGCVWTGDSRLLTIRAGAGYAPIIENAISTNGTDHLILEGLALRGPLVASGGRFIAGQWDGEKPPFPQRGSILKLRNCSAHSIQSYASGWLLPSGLQTPEIVNCDFPQIQVALPSGGSARIRNSVFGFGYFNCENASGEPASLEIDHCAFFAPEPRLNYWRASAEVQSPITLIATQSVFVSPQTIMAHPATTFIQWSGKTNVFAKLYHFQHGRGAAQLAQWQADRQTDSDSIELMPWEFDPAQWRILRKNSPGYELRPDGTDYGADIDRLVKALAL
jgi:hypothetical protein